MLRDPSAALGALAAFLLAAPAGAEPPIDLGDIAAGDGGFVAHGYGAGFSVSGAGDVNGDGLDDVVVASPGSYYTGYTGESYVVFGKADGTPVDLDDVATGTGGFIIRGADAYDSASRVSSAGDVNGDGLDDVIIGAQWASPGGRYTAGESYVVFGKATTEAVSLADVAGGTGGFVINGIDDADFSGRSVSGAGDVNGDGLDDVIVGAYSADPAGQDQAGESYVIFGKATTTPVELSAVAGGAGGFVINGISASDQSGLSVSGARDVNGDGLDDLVVGAWLRNAAIGVSYVVFGKADGAPVELSSIAAGSGGFAMTGATAGDQAGRSVSAAGDVNADGLADVIVGASGNGGQAYVVFGKANTSTVDLADVGAGVGGFRIASGVGAANSVSGAGDFNGDGLDDVLVGDHWVYGQTGAAYLVFGKADGTPVEIADIAAGGSGGIALNGVDPGEWAGYSVSIADDVNGDGFDDVVVGAWAGLEGEAYVVFGFGEELCEGDISGDGTVNIGDLIAILSAWGNMGGPEDLDGSGTVAIGDLLLVLTAWGPCA